MRLDYSMMFYADVNLLDTTWYNSSASYKEISDLLKKVQKSVKNSMIYTTIADSLGFSDYRISCIANKKKSLNLKEELTRELQEFEKEILYSYSDTEDLMIRHGDSMHGYEDFFNTLGKPYFYIVRHKKNKEITKVVKGETKTFLRKKGEIAAVACCVLRTVRSNNGNSIKAWYVCDLKVGEKYLGEHLPVLLVKTAAWRILQCPRGFGVCKDQPNGQMAKSANVVMQHGPFSKLRRISFNLYALSAKQIKKIEADLGTRQFQEIERVFRKNKYIDKNGHFNFTSNEGLKDYYIVNKKTKKIRPRKLLHAVPAGKGQFTSKEDYEHMFFALKGTSIDNALHKIGEGRPGRLINFRERCGFRITSAEI